MLSSYIYDILIQALNHVVICHIWGTQESSCFSLTFLWLLTCPLYSVPVSFNLSMLSLLHFLCELKSWLCYSRRLFLQLWMWQSGCLKVQNCHSVCFVCIRFAQTICLKRDEYFHCLWCWSFRGEAECRCTEDGLQHWHLNDRGQCRVL